MWHGLVVGVHVVPEVQGPHMPLSQTPAPPSDMVQAMPVFPGDHVVVLVLGWHVRQGLLGSTVPAAC